MVNWKDSLRSIQQCERVSGDLDEPSVIPFLGWEWTQNSLNKDTHYGHKNIIIKGIKDDEVPQIVVAIASPTGLDVNNIIPNADTPIMLIATQMPVPKKNSKILIKNTVRNISVIFF